MQANAENSLVIKQLMHDRQNLRNQTYSPYYIFDVLMRSHRFFNAIDELVICLKNQNSP